MNLILQVILKRKPDPSLIRLQLNRISDLQPFKKYVRVHLVPSVRPRLSHELLSRDLKRSRVLILNLRNFHDAHVLPLLRKRVVLKHVRVALVEKLH